MSDRIWPPLYVIGLTGGIAAGKSTVSAYLSELGAYVIDADEVAHQVTLPGSVGFSKVVEEFGTRVVTPEGSLDRRKLGQVVFNDKAALRVLNSIIHPLVIRRINFVLEILARNSGYRDENLYVVLDVPLLYETGMDKICDEVWVVAVNFELQVKRLMERDGYCRKEAISRIEAQMTLETKMKLAQAVIDNSGSVESTKQRVRELWQDLDRKLKQPSRT